MAKSQAPQPQETMTQSRALQPQEKKELVSKEETTVPVRYFVPTTDIFETEDALTVVMEVPGVGRDAIDITTENDVLKIEAKIDPAKYDGMEPLYTEYNVGHFARSFTLSNKIDRQQISAKLEDGVLTLTLKKVQEAIPRKIAIG
jgi:HSP20 family molecular chaperone IbpA